MIPQKPTEAQRRAAEFIGRAFLVRALAEVRVWGDPDKRTWGSSNDTRDLKGKKN